MNSENALIRKVNKRTVCIALGQLIDSRVTTSQVYFVSFFRV